MLPMIGGRREICEDELIDYWRALIMKKIGADSSPKRRILDTHEAYMVNRCQGKVA